jgi:hypothetical protein
MFAVSKTRPAVATAKRAEVIKRVVVTNQASSSARTKPVTKVPLHITMRNFSLRQKVDALVASTLYEADGSVGEVLETLLSTTRWLSFKLDDRKHRINTAWELSDLAADVRRSTMEIVHSVPRNITVTKYPEKNEGMSQ